MAAPAVAAAGKVAVAAAKSKVVRRIVGIIVGLVGAVFLILVVLFFAVLAMIQSQQAEASGAPGAVGDIPAHIVGLYQRAAQTCPGLDWTVVAAVGKVESGHGTFRGATVDATTFQVTPPVIGIPLNGTNNTRAIRDTDGGRYDGDTVWDRAVGPMQFIPSTWASRGVDGNGDGVADPHNYADAVFSAAGYLCSLGAGGGGWNPGDPLFRAIAGYNGSSGNVHLYRDAALQIAADAAAAAAAGAGGGVAGGPYMAGQPMPMPAGPVPISQTTMVTSATGAQVRVYAPAAGWWQALFDAAKAQGVPLSGGGWRDPQSQIRLREQRCPGRVYDRSCRGNPPTAVPGSSRHEFGVAVDFTCPSSTIGSRSGPCWNFLNTYGAQFGVKNLPSEPWHWSADGR